MQINTAFLIITYGNNYLDSCINSIRKYYNNAICIVDNNLSSNFNLKKYDNILYSNNEKNSYELGAIWFATKKWPNISKFIILHNSLILIKKLPDEIFSKDYIPFWTANVGDYSPVVPWVEKKLSSININLEYNKIWDSICGCCCLINTSLLKKLINLKYDRLYAVNKIESVGTEILFGYMIHIILNIKYKPLHLYPIYTYIQKKEKWIWIQKIGQGQGNLNIHLNTININENLFKNLVLKPNLNINQILIEVLKYVDKNSNIQDYIINSYPHYLKSDKISDRVLNSVRHRMFTKKYFPNYYVIEFNKIINNEKKIFF